MARKILYVFLEGDSDERFLKGTLEERLKIFYDDVKTIQWAQKKAEQVNNYIKSIQSQNHDYIFWADLDNCTSEQKINNIVQTRTFVDPDKIFIVAKMIESWYIAGMDPGMAKKLGLAKYQQKSVEICKMRFSSIRPRRFDSNTDFMVEILKNYSLALGRKNNDSFDVFYSKIFA